MPALSRAVVLALALAAVPATAVQPVRFPHERHLHFLSLWDPPPRGDARCTACHELPAAGAPSITLRSACSWCHEGEVPAYARAAPLPARPSTARLEVVFTHERHSGPGRLACGDCHRPVAAFGTTRRSGRAFTVDRDCLGCHARTRADERACQRCHAEDAKNGLPPDHAGGWRRSGHSMAEGPEDDVQHGRACRSCHGNDPCARCHRQREPQDHTTPFKLRLHGNAASWERERCMVCHESGTCAQCHATTLPLNHTGAWRSTHMLAAGAVGNESCAVCHRRSFCDACHREAP